LDWASNSSADEEAVEGYVFAADGMIHDFSGENRVNVSADCGRVLWSIDEEDVVNLAGVLLPDKKIDDDCLAVDKEHF